ncbi:MAG: hypothetical protein LUH14_01570 [Clostridiaceae bacterium]|nr:hypothetical protein [Clostridiaceae bacterium]
MSSKIRNLVKELEQEKEINTILPEYVRQYMMLGNRHARIKLMMEYYMFYETISEGINPYIDTAQDITAALHQVVETVYEKKPGAEELLQLSGELLRIRGEITGRMQVLTAYVDRFVVYEYILNRVQYRFEDQEMLPADSVFARDLVNFIFSSQDNVTISDNIRFVIGQLPMRMARNHYYDLIRNCISLYKGADKSSLDGFLYMFRTNAMLYQNEAMGEYFTEFVPVLEELSALDYEKLDYQTYQIYAEKIRSNASKLNDISDLYMQLAQLVNELYIICVTEKYAGEENDLSAAATAVRGVNSLFLQKESEVWQPDNGEPVETEEEKMYWLGGLFQEIEGKQEQTAEALNMVGAVLEETMENQSDAIHSLGLEPDFVILKKIFLLTSNSVFAELEEISSDGKVTEEMAEETAAQLIAECKSFFQGKSRMLRRAVMANTLENMPVFFQTAQEVADYVTNALAQCDDEAEKYASKQLLMEIMH